MFSLFIHYSCQLGTLSLLKREGVRLEPLRFSLHHQDDDDDGALHGTRTHTHTQHTRVIDYSNMPISSTRVSLLMNLPAPGNPFDPVDDRSPMYYISISSTTTPRAFSFEIGVIFNAGTILTIST